MKITNSTIQDIDTIFKLYDIATEYQKQRFKVHWPKFERKNIEIEIQENRQWKLIIDDKIACIWATTFSDKEIWQEKNKDEAVYIHRIATNPNFRGQNFVKIIVEWAILYAKENHKNFIRLDTVGNNEKLIKKYTENGFKFLGLYYLKSTENLPPHYTLEDPISLFEIKI